MGSSARQLSDSPDAIRVREFYAGLVEPEQLRPRVRMALRLYVHTAVPSIRAAAKAMGLNVNYLQNISRTKAGIKFMETAHTHINNTALQTNELIDRLSRRAIEVIATTMEDASSEGLRLKAAIDLADRGPETSKVHKHQIESFMLSGEDAREIASSMVEAARVRQANANLRDQNFDKVNLDGDEVLAPIALPAAHLKLEP